MPQWGEHKYHAVVNNNTSPIHQQLAIRYSCASAIMNRMQHAKEFNQQSMDQLGKRVSFQDGMSWVPDALADTDEAVPLSARTQTPALTNEVADDHESVIGSWPPIAPKGIRKKAAETLGFSAVAMEMLREQEDRDLHPFGRGGRFEGVLYSRRVKVQVDHTKFLAWIVFASFILLTSGAIIFLAEMERRQKSQQSASTIAASFQFTTPNPANRTSGV